MTLVVGRGVSGQGAIAHLQRRGIEVESFDDRDETPMPDVTRFRQLVISPGVPPSHPLIVQARAEGIEVLGEAELALRELKCRAVGITGTNGKTTVTLLTTHLLRESGHDAHALGNVGTALTEGVDRLGPDAIAVVELSSYQLETMESKVFDAGVILNVSPDHLDRYSTFEEYAAAKGRLRNCLKEGAPLFAHSECKERFQADFVYNCPRSVEAILPISYRGRGSLDVENALAALSLCAQVAPVSADGLETFVKPPHRMEWVRELEGVTYINDSKGTNLVAMEAAIHAVEGPVILIAGGQSKGADFGAVREAFRRVRAVCAVGESAEQIGQEWGEVSRVELCGTLERAIMRSREMARPGDTVLLSPGCSSFDQFRDYAQRGDLFKIIINKFEEHR